MARLIVHRGTAEIGGTCIELTSERGQRLILDIGRPLDAGGDAPELLPATLDLSGEATVLICHPHQDHWGLVGRLPAAWEVMTGMASAKLIAIGARLAGEPLSRELTTWSSRGSFYRGDFRITPYLTDHSGFDAYMLLIEVDGRRILYSGDFREHGRKGSLVTAAIADPPRNVDVLIIEGTNLGTGKPTMKEQELEESFLDLARRTPRRVFATWSAQNIDRTVTLYRAALRSGRELVIDLYTAEILEALKGHLKAPFLGIRNLKVVLTRGLASHYRRLGREDWVSEMARIGIGAAGLEQVNGIVMIRGGSLQRDYIAKGVRPTPEDAFSFSMWSGYMKDQAELLNWFRGAGTRIEHLHTSGHASAQTLQRFAAAVAATHVVPVHGQNWDAEGTGFERIKRLADGQTMEV